MRMKKVLMGSAAAMATAGAITGVEAFLGVVVRTHVDEGYSELRRDEDTPIPVPPGEDLPSPVKEPPDKPVLEPDNPVREPGPEEPTRL